MADQEHVETQVVFTSEQQSRIDALVRESTAKAAAEQREAAAKALEDAQAARAEAEVLKAENLALKGERLGLERESKTSKEELVRAKKDSAIKDAAAKHNFVSPSQLAKLVADDLVWNGKQFVVQGEDGTERLGIDGQPLGLDAYFGEFAAKNPHLVKGSVLPGVGSRENQIYPSATQGEADRLKRIFGKGSNSMEANSIGVKNPLLYKQLKREARALGLIP